MDNESMIDRFISHFYKIFNDFDDEKKKYVVSTNKVSFLTKAIEGEKKIYCAEKITTINDLFETINFDEFIRIMNHIEYKNEYSELYKILRNVLIRFLINKNAEEIVELLKS